MKRDLIIFPLTICLLASAQALAEDKPIWKPAVGDSWSYRVAVTVQEGTELPKDIPGQKIEKFDGKTRATYLQEMVYRGLQPLGEAKDGEAVTTGHAFTISVGGTLVETQFNAISDTAIDALGVQPAGKELKPLSKPIPLVGSGWKGGEAFPFMMEFPVDGKNVRMVRKFKVIGWETLETKAGKFKALHVQVTGLNGQMEIKRSYWFTPGTGFIKEVKKYYVGERTILTQTRVLEKMSSQ
ncbi:MAG: hypothetical protein AB8F34_11900 [Akkermansiaceae bacterium]